MSLFYFRSGVRGTTKKRCVTYHVYPKYSNTLTPCHIYPKIDQMKSTKVGLGNKEQTPALCFCGLCFLLGKEFSFFHFLSQLTIDDDNVNGHSPSYGSRQAKMCLWEYADSAGPDQTAHPHSLIRAFTVRFQNHWILQNVWMESKDPDDTLCMHRMIWICAFCACSKAFFAYAAHIMVFPYILS